MYTHSLLLVVLNFYLINLKEENRNVGGSERSFLAKTLIRQLREEQEIYVSEILREFKPTAVDVSVAELRRAFAMVDPMIGTHIQFINTN